MTTDENERICLDNIATHKWLRPCSAISNTEPISSDNNNFTEQTNTSTITTQTSFDTENSNLENVSDCSEEINDKILRKEKQRDTWSKDTIKKIGKKIFKVFNYLKRITKMIIAHTFN